MSAISIDLFPSSLLAVLVKVWIAFWCFPVPAMRIVCRIEYGKKDCARHSTRMCQPAKGAKAGHLMYAHIY